MSIEWTSVAQALALVLVIEGLMPFAAPGQWRQAMIIAAQLDNRRLRLLGLSSMLAGLILLQLI